MRLIARVIEGEIMGKEGVFLEMPFTTTGYGELWWYGKKHWDLNNVSKYEIAAFSDAGKLISYHRPDQYNFSSQSLNHNLIEVATEKLLNLIENDFEEDEVLKSIYERYQMTWARRGFDPTKTYPTPSDMVKMPENENEMELER